MTIRSFISFEASSDVQRMLTEFQTHLKAAGADVRWEPASKFHATIKFLGDVKESMLPQLVETIEAVFSATPPFSADCNSHGAFPSMKRPRIIWAGCENPDGTLFRSKQGLDQALLPLGFEIDNREFHPHITLGRVRSPHRIKHLIDMMESLNFEQTIFDCRAIKLMKSVLKPGGSEYSIIHSFPLS